MPKRGTLWKVLPRESLDSRWPPASNLRTIHVRELSSLQQGYPCNTEIPAAYRFRVRCGDNTRRRARALNGHCARCPIQRLKMTRRQHLVLPGGKRVSVRGDPKISSSPRVWDRRRWAERTSAVNNPSRSYPRGAMVRRIKLWISRPAATRTIKERAISATTRLRLVRWLKAARDAAWAGTASVLRSNRAAMPSMPAQRQTGRRLGLRG